MNSKVVLMTGAAKRIGATTARLLHDAGMNLVLHYNTSRVDAEKLCEELNAKRANSAVILQAELSTTQDISQLIAGAVQAWGRLDALVNNASQFFKTDLGQATEKEWDDLLNPNLKVPFFLCQAAAPYLKQQQGCIVNITDIHAERPVKDYAIYCISKAGLVMLTKSLAKEWGPDIRVNAVSPGAIAWPEGDNELTEDLKQKIIDRTVLRRPGEPNDIAKAVLYFVRDATYVTGQILAVDGGRSLKI